LDRALFASATGMAAQQQNLDTIADNLANADVPGFKGSVDAFAELAAPGERGLGTVSLGSHVLFTQGKLARSGGPFDLAIEGPGFFAVVDPQGRPGYTRGGAFTRAADGSMCDEQGNRLRGLKIPADALALSVTPDGTVRAGFAGGSRAVGSLRITEFAAPDRLRDVGGTFFEATPECGPPRAIVPGAKNGPQLRVGMLEQSNVSIIDAMMQILTAQRAYEANAKGVQAADEMLRIANNLQRG
jgi:flagellar basal-body rod protein FlgG